MLIFNQKVSWSHRFLCLFFQKVVSSRWQMMGGPSGLFKLCQRLPSLSAVRNGSMWRWKYGGTGGTHISNGCLWTHPSTRCVSTAPSLHVADLTEREKRVLDKLYDGLVKGHRAALAESITLVETQHPRKRELAQVLLQRVLAYRQEQERANGNQPVAFRIGQ